MVSAAGSSVVSAAGSSVVSAAGSSVVSAAGSSVVSAAGSSWTNCSAMAAALASLFSFSAANFSFSALASSLAIDEIFDSIFDSFSANHLENFSSACSAVKAPFLTPIRRWFL